MALTQSAPVFRLAILTDTASILKLVREYHALDHLPFDESMIRPVVERRVYRRILLGAAL